MADANYRLNVEINTRATSSGNFNDATKSLNNLKNAAMATARSFGPMSDAIGRAFAQFSSQKAAVTANIFGDMSKGIKAEAAKIVSGTDIIKEATASSAAAMIPMRDAVRSSVAALSGTKAPITAFGTALHGLSQKTTISTSAIKDMVIAANYLADNTTGKLKVGMIDLRNQLTKLSQQTTITGGNVGWINDQFNNLMIKTSSLPASIKRFVMAMSNGVPTTQATAIALLKVAQIAATQTVPGFEAITDQATAMIPSLTKLVQAFANLQTPPEIQRFMTEMDKGVPKTEAAAIKLRDLAIAAGNVASPRFAELTAKIRALSAAFDELVQAKRAEQLTPEMATVQKGMAGAPPTTGQAANKLFKDLQVLKIQLADMGPEYDSIRNAMAEVDTISEKWTSDLEELTAVQRRNVSASRGMVQHTVETNEAMMVAQSAAQGVMMGYGALRGSILQLGFSLIFLRWSEISVALATAALTVQFGILQKAIFKVTKAMIDNGKVFLEQERLTRRFETDVAKKSRAYEVLVRSAMVSGRTAEDVAGAWEALASAGLAGASAQASAMDLASYLGISASEAAGKMVSVAKGSADEFKALAVSLGETDKEYINHVKAQWNLMTTEQKLNTVMTETAKFAKDAGKEYAESFGGLTSSIGEAWRYATGKLGGAFIKNFINPMLVAIKDFALAFKSWLDEWMASEGAIKLMEQLKSTGVAMGKALSELLKAVGEALRQMIPTLLPLVNMGMKVLTMFMYPLARSIKLIVPLVALLTAVLTKFLVGFLITKVKNLSILQAAISKVGISLSDLSNPIGYAVGRLKYFHGAALDAFMQMKGVSGSTIKGMIAYLGSLGSNLTKTAKNFMNMGLAFFKSPIGIVITILGLLAMVIMKNEKAMAAFQRIMSAFTPLIEIVSDFIGDLAEGVATSLTPVLTEVVEILAEILVPILNAVAFVLEVIVGVIRFVTDKLKFLIPVIRALVVAYGTWIAAQWALNVAMDANPIGLVVLAVAALVSAFAALYHYWDKIPGWVKIILRIVVPITNVIDAVKNWKKNMENLKKVWNALSNSPGWVKAILTVINPLSGLIKLIKNWGKVTEVIKRISQTFGNVLSWLSGSIKPVTSGIKAINQHMGGSSGFSKILQRFNPIVLFTIRFLRQMLSPIWLLVNGLKRVVSWVQGFGRAWDLLKTLLNPINMLQYLLWGDDEEGGGLVGWVQDQWQKITDWLATAPIDLLRYILFGDDKEGGGIVGWFQDQWNKVCAIWGNFGAWITKKFSDAWDGIKTSFAPVKQFFVDTWNAVKLVFEPVKSFFSDTFTSAWNGVKLAWAYVSSFFTDVWNGICTAFTSVYNFFYNLFTSAKDAVLTAFGPVLTFFSDIWRGIKSGLQSFVNLMISGINIIIGGLNKLSFTVPDIIGVPHRGETFGINITPIQPVTLAKGAITRKGHPIIAEIGEGSDREVVSPLSELPRLLGRSAGTGGTVIEVNITGNTILNDAMVSKISDEVSRKIFQAMNKHRPVSTVGY